MYLEQLLLLETVKVPWMSHVLRAKGHRSATDQANTGVRKARTPPARFHEKQSNSQAWVTSFLPRVQGCPRLVKKLKSLTPQFAKSLFSGNKEALLNVLLSRNKFEAMCIPAIREFLNVGPKNVNFGFKIAPNH